MPTPTYTPLANITLGSTATSVTFSSISQAYRDLIVVLSVKASSVSSPVYMRFNYDEDGGNYPAVYARGDGSSAWSATNSSPGIKIFPVGNVPTTAIVTAQLSVMDYSATDKHKTTISRHDYPASNTIMQADRWANTTAVTTIIFTAPSSAFAVDSTFALYGIAA